MKRIWHRIFGHPSAKVWHMADVHIFWCNGCYTRFSPCGVVANKKGNLNPIQIFTECKQ